MAAFPLGCILLFLMNYVSSECSLASLLLLCTIAKCRRKSGRLQMLIMTHFTWLVPIFSGISCLVLWPSLCISLVFSFWLLRSVTFRLASKIEDMSTRLAHVPGTRTATRRVPDRSSETKRLERKAQKKASKRKRSLVFFFGSSFLWWFESLLSLWLLIIQLFVPLMCVLVPGKLLGTFACALNVTLHILALSLKLAVPFLLAIPSALNLVVSFLHCLCWISCFHFYLKLLHILHCCGLLPDGLRPLLRFLCRPQHLFPLYLRELSFCKCMLLAFSGAACCLCVAWLTSSGDIFRCPCLFVLLPCVVFS